MNAIKLVLKMSKNRYKFLRKFRIDWLDLLCLKIILAKNHIIERFMYGFRKACNLVFLWFFEFEMR